MNIRGLLAVLLLACPVVVVAGPVIKKCQDANGQWHYGDTASAECAHSTVTEMNAQGVEVRKQAPPLTQKQLEAEQTAKKKAAAQRQQEAHQRKEDARLLSTYDSVEAIIRARDERIESIDKFITINNELIANLKQNLTRLQGELKGANEKRAESLKKDIARTQAQIADYEGTNEQRKQEREAVRQRYDKDLARYRELTGADDKAGSGSGSAPAQQGGAVNRP